MTRFTHPLSPLVLAAVVAMLAMGSGCNGPSEASLLASARSHLARKEPDAARIQLKTLLQSKPDSGEARFMLGQLMADAGEPQAAEAELRRALEARHPDTAVLPLLAQVMLSLGQSQLLLSQFGQTQLSDPVADATLKTHLAAAHASEGQMDKAQALVASALQRQPGAVPALLLQARLLAATDSPAAGLKALDQLLQTSPDLAQAWAQKGDLLALRSGPADTEAALAAWRKSLALKPDNVAVHGAVIRRLLAVPDIASATTQLAALKQVAPKQHQTVFFEAVLSAQRGDYNQARELSQQLLRASPDNLQVLLLAGQAEQGLGALAKAETLFGRAVQLAPKATAPRRMLAQLQLRAGQADKALASLRPLLDEQPTDTEVLHLAAQAQLTKGDSKAAELLFERAAKRQPDDPRARTALALAQLAKGKDSSAFSELKAIASSHRSTVADLALINALLSRNQLPAAQQAIKALAVKTPGDALPEQLLGRIALQQRDVGAARKHFELALAKNADYMPALAGLAALDLQQKQPAAASQRFEAMLQRHPQHAGAMMALAEISNRNGDGAQALQWLEKAVKAEPNEVTARMLLVDLYLGQQQPKLALSAARAGLVAVPGHVELLDRQGRAQMVTGDPQGALLSFTQLASQMPRSPLPLLRLADAHQANGDKQAMAESVRRAQALAPNDPLVLQAAVTLAVQQEKWPQALTAARALQSHQPGEALGLLLEGDIALRQQQWDTAAAAYRKALAKPRPGEAPLRLHLTLLRAGKAADAERFATEWQTGHADDLRFVMHLGDLAASSGQPAQAEQHYRAVLAKLPEHVLALNNLAYLLARQNKPGAVALAEQALKRAPNAPAVMDTLAFSLAADKQLEKAIALQLKAVAMAPDAPAYRLQLAKLHLQGNDTKTARTELQTLAKLGERFNRQAEVQALLKANGG